MSTTTLTMEPVAQRKRKRTRSSESHDGENEKRRGRPRVEKQDESAADRRRTQIRMAQRAYRQRKESTLEELRKRVSELTNTLELVNKAFADFRDQVSTVAVPSQQPLIREASIQIEALMKEARNPSDVFSQPDQAGYQSMAAATGAVDIPVQRRNEPQNTTSWLDQSLVNRAPKQTSPLEVGLGYSVCGVEAGEDYFNLQPDAHHAVSSVQKAQELTVYDALTSSLPDDIRIPRQLSTITTYSFQETSFARRLHRACLEAGYYLLLDPTRLPHTFERVFRLSLMGRNKAKLTAALKSMLARGTHESLDFWEAPLIHVGGAGTHYPRRDHFGNIQARKSSYNLGLVGPQTLALLENAAKNNLSTDMTVEIAGYEGEWYDPYDVEGYLEERGIRIDPSTSFVEAEISEAATPDSGSTATSSNISTPKDFSPADATAPFNDEQLAVLSTESMDISKWHDWTDMTFTGVGYSDALTGDWMNFLEPGQGISGLDNHTQTTWESSGTTELMQDAVITALDKSTFRPPYSTPRPNTRPLQPQKKSVIIDVSKFVKALTISGVCLGRTPGYKRRDVDRALAIASFDL